MINTHKQKEKVVLVCYINKKEKSIIPLKETLDELSFLAETAGAKVVKTFFQEKDSFDSRFVIGKGKVDEISIYTEANDISLVIFENELGYTQLRNLEQKIKCKILDKSNLILDIFAQNARTAQAKLQVELAQLEYLLPRLTRQWTHLSKQYGGIGTKGPGETQIETDRRLINTRISVLKNKLKTIVQQRKTQSEERKKYIRLALVGYTNAGKSTLLNMLTDSDVYVENKLFATLDTSTRALNLSRAGKNLESRFPKKVLISDTVGFIRNLPHNLIESFKSTLSEVVESDFLLHVIDVSNTNFEEQISVVNDTLEEIGADNKKIIHIFNKVDKLNDKDLLKEIRRKYSHSVAISASKGINLNSLIETLRNEISENNIERIIRLKPDNYKGLNQVYKLADVKEVKYLKTSIKIKLETNEKNILQLEKLSK
ncbi:MAG TPA: GTPase HflX [Ignavibacteria bacterium]